MHKNHGHNRINERGDRNGKTDSKEKDFTRSTHLKGDGLLAPRAKGGPDMEKIVVLTNPAKEDNMLIACLHVLFPECEIRVQSSRGKDIRDCNGIRGVDPDNPGGRKWQASSS